MTDPIAPPDAAQATRPQPDRLRQLARTLLRGERPYMLYIAFAILLVVFSLASPWFLSLDNFLNIGRQTALVSIIAVGMTFVIIARQIDLSVGSTLALSGMIAALAMAHIDNNWFVGAVAGIGTGALVGLINGVLVTRAKINSFIATLGSGTLLLGLNQWYTGGRQVVGVLPHDFILLSARIDHTGIPATVVYVLVISLVLWVVFDYLPLGRFLYIIGDSPRAAELSGISATTHVTLAFIASGTLAAFAGIILQAQLQVGQSTVGQELMLPAFTGALLGATAIRPGRPNVWGTVLAVAVLAVAVAGLTQLGAPFFVENLFNGAMLILAVGLAVATHRRRERRGAGGEGARR